jgi:hypothetical protein
VVISIKEQEEEQAEEEKLSPKRFEVLTAIAHQQIEQTCAANGEGKQRYLGIISFPTA